MKSPCTDGSKKTNHDLCWDNGRWSYKSRKCSSGETHWKQTLQACMLHFEDLKDQSGELPN